MLSIFFLLAALLALNSIANGIWNLYFHPLKHVPGPKVWIAFPLFRYISAIRGRLDIDMRHYHSVYGDVVRFSPCEVSFITAQAWKEIYGHGHEQMPKALASAQGTMNIISANDADHSRFRKSLSHAFSAKGLRAQEPILAGYIDALIRRMGGFADSCDPIDMVKLYNLTTFDIIGDLAFGESFGGLQSAQYHHRVSSIFQSVKVLSFIHLKDNFPLFYFALSPFLPRQLKSSREKQQLYTGKTVRRRLSHHGERRHGDFIDSMLQQRGNKDGLSEIEIESNSRILVLAGSDTTASLLSGLTYWLLRTPQAMNKATTEVRSMMVSETDITFANVTAKLPYLLACINEGFRMYPPVPGGLQRITPSRMLEISEHQIPPHTRVSVHQSAAYWSANNFHLPECFLPERWMPDVKRDPTSPFFYDNRDVLQPFSVGPRNCLGKNLALNEIRVILARVLWNFDMKLCKDSEDWTEQSSYNLIWERPPLKCELRRRTDRI